jgi:hypothetical protein
MFCVMQSVFFADTHNKFDLLKLTGFMTSLFYLSLMNWHSLGGGLIPIVLVT